MRYDLLRDYTPRQSTLQKDWPVIGEYEENVPVGSIEWIDRDRHEGRQDIDDHIGGENTARSAVQGVG